MTPTVSLRLPFTAHWAVTQPYGVQNDAEPSGWHIPSGDIVYVPAPGGVLGHWHNGIDYGLDAGTPVLAAAAGTVTAAGWDSTGFGLRVQVDHGAGVSTLYGHLTGTAVQVGQHVPARALLGHSGSTGNSTGPHLHWSVLTGVWHFTDPAPYLVAAPTPPPLPPLPTHSAAEYAAAAWVAHISEMTRGIPVAHCAAVKAQVQQYVKEHA